MTLSAIPGLDGVQDRVTKVRGLAFAADRARLVFLDDVYWEVDRPRLEVVRRGVLFSRVSISGHKVSMHRRCATELASLWSDVR